jgi:hypothetical protein
MGFSLQCKNPDCRVGRSCGQFPEEEYINGIFIAVYCTVKEKKREKKILIAGLEIMRGTWFHDLSWQPAQRKKTNPDCRAGMSCTQFPGQGYINGVFITVYIKEKNKS